MGHVAAAHSNGNFGGEQARVNACCCAQSLTSAAALGAHAPWPGGWFGAARARARARLLRPAPHTRGVRGRGRGSLLWGPLRRSWAAAWRRWCRRARRRGRPRARGAQNRVRGSLRPAARAPRWGWGSRPRSAASRSQGARRWGAGVAARHEERGWGRRARGQEAGAAASPETACSQAAEALRAAAWLRRLAGPRSPLAARESPRLTFLQDEVTIGIQKSGQNTRIRTTRVTRPAAFRSHEQPSSICGARRPRGAQVGQPSERAARCGGASGAGAGPSEAKGSGDPRLRRRCA